MTTPNIAEDLNHATEVAGRALTLPDQVAALTIASHQDFEAAGVLLVDIRTHRKAIAEAFEPAVQKAFAAHKAVVALRNRADQVPAEAERAVKVKMATYQQEQARLRREAEERARQDREREEAAARADYLRRQREAQAEAERQRLADAEAAMDSGDLARAETLLETPVAAPLVAPPAPVIPAPVEAPAAPKAAGVSIRGRWAYRIVDELRIDRRYLCADEKKIAQIVRALGPDAVAAVGGIEVYQDAVVAARVR